MKGIYVPTTSAEDWQTKLADGEKQWKTGHSAKAMAYAWEDAKGFPPEVKNVFEKSDGFQDMELLMAMPEHQVLLPGGGHASQNDLWVLAKNINGLVSMAVEGKVSEPFGPTIDEWFQEPSKGKQERLNYLTDLLSLKMDSIGEIRYQLLHRTTSAIQEARRFGASRAMMMVHSFSPECKWFDDFKAYGKLFGIDAECGQIYKAGTFSQVELFFAWVRGEGKYLLV